MRNILLAFNLLLTLLVPNNAGQSVNADTSGMHSSKVSYEKGMERPNRDLAIQLSTAHGKSIQFNTGEENQTAPQNNQIPHLVLTRNGVPTPGFERTLVLSVGNLTVPESGLRIQLLIETQHVDPDQDRANQSRIQVRKESTFLTYDASLKELREVQFRITFDPSMKLQDQTMRTPTDYYRYRILISDGQGKRLKSYVRDFAFLIENQWRVPLPPVLEDTPGAAPDELLVYYYDMIPFQTDRRDTDTRIPRQEVGRYIQTELVPQMVKAFETQTNLWNLPWYAEWSNSRIDEDPKTLSVALGGSKTWYHGKPPSLGHSMISIRVDGSFSAYSNLTDGIMSVFHHELFHNQQRNLSFHFGSKGRIAGPEEAWEVFSEGTAVLASAIGQPSIQFAAEEAKSYVKWANAFIGAEGTTASGLNQRHSDIPYHTALYWRFLYENCGGVTARGEDPAAGMKVIRNALETLYKGEVAQINSPADVAGAFPLIMDHALQSTPSCALHDYEESLIEFARAVYLLRLQDRSCPGSAGFSQCGLADPNKLYHQPHADTYLVTQDTLTEIKGSIPSSYGIDFVDLALGTSLHGKKLKILIENTSESSPEFHVEVWKTRTIYGMQESQPVQIIEPVSLAAGDDGLILEMKDLNLAAFDGLGLIITRVDPYEATESTGAYTVRLLPE